MSILSDTDILFALSPSSTEGFKEAIQQSCWVDSNNKLLIYPFQDELVTPLGYDLTVGGMYLSLSKKTKLTLEIGEKLVISPNETVLISTTEYIGLPKSKKLAGIILSMVSIVSLGLSHISTTLDNDWEGHLLIGITNLQKHPVTLNRGQSFCTAMFFVSQSPATRPCGKTAGRLDITAEHIDHWLMEARQAEGSLLRRMLPALIPLVIIVIVSLMGLWIFGPTEGFSGSVAIGTAVAMIVYSILQEVLRKAG